MKISGALALFDIDGTLLTSAGNGLRAMRQTMKRHYGLPDAVAGVAFAGRTDRSIWLEMFARGGLAPERYDRDCRQLHRTYAGELRRNVAADAGTVCPGLPELLEEMRNAGMVLGLLTGNLAIGAEIKLRGVGLWEYFGPGAFGDNDTERPPLLAKALAAAKIHTGFDFSAPQAVVIGDTLHDLRCARAGGAKAVLVATGTVPADELRAGEPDLFYDDFSDYKRVAEEIREFVVGNGE